MTKSPGTLQELSRKPPRREAREVNLKLVLFEMDCDIICYKSLVKCGGKYLLIVHTALLYLSFLFQFEHDRFEMIIIMPSNHRGLKFFHLEALAKFEVPNTDGTVLDEALEALEKRRTVHELHVINMPSFKVDTNMDVQKHLRTVNTLFIHIIAYYF